MTTNLDFLTPIVNYSKNHPDFLKVHQKIFSLINVDAGYVQYPLRNPPVKMWTKMFRLRVLRKIAKRQKMALKLDFQGTNSESNKTCCTFFASSMLDLSLHKFGFCVSPPVLEIYTQKQIVVLLTIKDGKNSCAFTKTTRLLNAHED